MELLYPSPPPPEAVALEPTENAVKSVLTAERSGGVYENTPVPVLYANAAVPAALVVTERSVNDIPEPPVAVWSAAAIHLDVPASHFNTCPSVGVPALTSARSLRFSELMSIEVRYVLLSTEPSAFKNCDDVPLVLTNLLPVISPVDPSICALHTLVARLPILSPTPSAVLIPTPEAAFKLIA